MYTFHVYKVLTTTLAPTVGFEPADLSAPLFSKQFVYNHLHTLAYPLIKPPVRFDTRLVRTSYYTSGDFPELPTTTPHGLWSYLSGKVFYRILLVGCVSCLVEKQARSDSNTYLAVLETAVLPIKLPTYDCPPFTCLVLNSRTNTIIPETFLKDFVKLYSFTFTP